MKKLILAILAVFALASCNNDKSYVIEGTLYGGAQFEGEVIYMVPFGSASTEGQDSAVIRDGRFRFEGEAVRPEICEIRMRQMMQLFIDKLVCIKEPGHVWIVLSKPSSTKGSPLNDSLQVWREYKAQVDEKISNLNKLIKKAEGEELGALRTELDDIRHDFDVHNKQIVDRNDNVFGEYIERYVR